MATPKDLGCLQVPQQKLKNMILGNLEHPKKSDKIPKKIGLKGKRESIFFLARNNYQLDGIEKELLINARPDLEFKFDTIHAAKGAEADIVVLIGLDGGPNGFPRWQEEDPLKSVFLPLNDQFKFSEQRRVLYVGLTRAKHQLFICHEKDESSIFFNATLKVLSSRSFGGLVVKWLIFKAPVKRFLFYTGK